MVVHATLLGSPPPNAAWRAGAWPCPACRTLPMITSWTSSALMPARSTAARMAVAPSSWAASPDRLPIMAPMGVRAAETITIGSFMSIPLMNCVAAARLRDADSARRDRERYLRFYRTPPGSAGSATIGNPAVGRDASGKPDARADLPAGSVRILPGTRHWHERHTRVRRTFRLLHWAPAGFYGKPYR